MEPLRAALLAQQNLVPSLARLLSFQSPQHPLNQRTRAKAASQPALYAAEAVESLRDTVSNAATVPPPNGGMTVQ